MEDLKEKKVGDIVAQNLRASKVFEKYGIDFCCKGNRTLEEVCKTHHLDPDMVSEELGEALELPARSGYDYNEWPIDLLADYIEKTHHRYTQKAIPEIVKKLEKLTNVHGEAHPELFSVLSIFKLSAIDLTNHMKREEMVLFPYIKKLVNEGKPASDEIPHFGIIDNPIKHMMSEHDTEGERFREIAQLTNNFALPPDGCNTYKLTMDMLKELDADLHLHIHLENNILFPKAVKLEHSL